MYFAIIMAACAAALHLVLGLPIGLAIIVALAISFGFWVLWKLKWIILGILGLEALFGGGDDA